MSALTRNSWLTVVVLTLIVGALVLVTYHATRHPDAVNDVPASPDVTEGHEFSAAK